jgi:hypothetical protein
LRLGPVDLHFSTAVERFAVSSRRLVLLVIALLFTLLNAFKPLLIDDAALEWNAREIAAHPLDPFGFAMFWYDFPEEANRVLTPPVLPYYWALARTVVGERPWAWKLALFPWALLFVGAVQALARRFARDVETPLLLLIVFSPAFLPSFNLMLDIPALALSLTAFHVFRVAVARNSYLWAMLSGLIVGVAAQTKYTAFLAPGLLLLYAVFTRRLRLWPAAVVVAVLVFVAWEAYTAHLYGRSHFLLALSFGGGLMSKLDNMPFLFNYLGGLLPAVFCLGLAALGVRRRWLLGAAGVLLGGYLNIALVDVNYMVRGGPSPMLFGPNGAEPVEFQLAELIFQLFSLGGTIILVLVLWRLLEQEWGQSWGEDLAGCETLFLMTWLALEVVGFLALTPFPATRRVLGVALVVTLLFGRLAATRATELRRSGTLAAVTVGGVLLGLGFFALDTYGAWVHKAAAERPAVRVRELDGEANAERTTWYVGHWGFQYYAERSGMRPVVRDYWHERPSYVPLPPPSTLKKGDWLVVPDDRLNPQSIELEGEPLELIETLSVGGVVPLRTVSCFYGGRVALEHNEGNGLDVRLYRVTADFVPHRRTPRPRPDPFERTSSTAGPVAAYE